MLNERLDHFARDRKVEHSPGVTYGGLMRRAAITLISRCNLSSTLVCRNLGHFVLCVNLTKNSGGLNSRKETGVAPQIFFVVAHALGNVTLIAQRLAKSTLDGPYKQFIHTLLWIISHPTKPTR
jgi:hypothetical protein